MKSPLLNLGTAAVRLVSLVQDARQAGVERALIRLGLERRSSPLAPALWFVAGAAVAGGAALVLAPSSGRDLRRKLGALWTSASPQASDSLSAAADSTQSSLRHGSTPQSPPASQAPPSVGAQAASFGHDKAPPVTKGAVMEGEGSYTATERYNAGLQKSVAEGNAPKLARDAAKALDGPEAKELHAAEAEAKAKARIPLPSK